MHTHWFQQLLTVHISLQWSAHNSRQTIEQNLGPGFPIAAGKIQSWCWLAHKSHHLHPSCNQLVWVNSISFKPGSRPKWRRLQPSMGSTHTLHTKSFPTEVQFCYVPNQHVCWVDVITVQTPISGQWASRQNLADFWVILSILKGIRSSIFVFLGSHQHTNWC